VVSSDYAGAVSAAPSGGYSRSMAEDRDSDRYVLFVTGPVRDRLYHRFASIFDGRDVVVKVDRRVSERRLTLLGGRRAASGVVSRAALAPAAPAPVPWFTRVRIYSSIVRPG
jgi:hypothetical protein